MKERVTVSLEKAAFDCVDALKDQIGCLRSEALEALIRAAQRQAQEAELARQSPWDCYKNFVRTMQQVS